MGHYLNNLSSNTSFRLINVPIITQSMIRRQTAEGFFLGKKKKVNRASLFRSSQSGPGCDNFLKLKNRKPDFDFSKARLSKKIHLPLPPNWRVDN